MNCRATLAVLAVGIVLSASGAPVSAQTANVTPVTDAVLQQPAPGDWLNWRRTLDGWGYSPLDDVDRNNVGDLQLAWSWGLEPGVSQTTPIVHDGVMYVANPGHVVQAIDARNGVSSGSTVERSRTRRDAPAPRCAALRSTRTSSS